MDENLKNRALKIFQDEQDSLDGVWDKQSDVAVPDTITNVSVTQNSDGTWNETKSEEKSNLYDESYVGTVEKQTEEDVKVLQEFCSIKDDIIISYNAQINSKKQDLVTLCTEAINRNCWAGIAYSTTTSGGTTINSGIGSTTQNFGDYSVVQDRDALEIYSNMAGPSANYGADNPFIPDNIVTLTSSYSGLGYENNRDNGALEYGDDATEVESGDYDPEKDSFESSTVVGTGRSVSSTSSDHAGPRNVGAFRAYAGVGVAPYASLTDLTGTDGQDRCVAIASSISTLISEIQSLRSQRDVAVSRSNLNTIKEKKMEKELQDWGNKNLTKKVDAIKTKNSSVISAINNI